MVGLGAMSEMRPGLEGAAFPGENREDADDATTLADTSLDSDNNTSSAPVLPNHLRGA